MPRCGFVLCLLLDDSGQEAMTRRIVVGWIRHGSFQLDWFKRIIAIEKSQTFHGFRVLRRNIRVEQEVTCVEPAASIKEPCELNKAAGCAEVQR